MSEQPRQFGWRAWLWPPFFTPRGLIHAAMVLALLFAAAHLLGWRSHTTILSGTLPEGATSGRFAVATGVLYVLLYFAFVLGSPILLIASGLMALLLRWTRPRPRISPAPDTGA